MIMARGLKWQRDQPKFSIVVIRHVIVLKYLLDEPLDELGRKKDILADS